MLQFLTRVSVFLTQAPADGEEAANVSIWDLLLSPSTLLMVVLIVAMYFIMIRPESKRKKAAAKMRNELIVGDEVNTVAGIVGRVVNIKDDTVTIETGSDKTRLTFVKGAITTKTETISS